MATVTGGVIATPAVALLGWVTKTSRNALAGGLVSVGGAVVTTSSRQATVAATTTATTIEKMAFRGADAIDEFAMVIEFLEVGRWQL